MSVSPKNITVSRKALISLLLSVGAIAVLVFAFWAWQNHFMLSRKSSQGFTPDVGLSKLERFRNAEEFRMYLQESQDEEYPSFGGFEADTRATQELAVPSTNVGSQPTNLLPDRYSQTNIQVSGIDEADIVKTDGTNIYFSSQNYYSLNFDRPTIESNFIFPPQPSVAKTKILSAFPPDSLSKLSEIDTAGNLFLQNNILTILNGNDVVSYDVSNPSNPQKLWETKFNTNTQIITSRSVDGVIYLITQTGIEVSQPCPIPLTNLGQEIVIQCVDIYHPITPINTDVTYTVLKIDSETGNTLHTNSVIGRSGTSVLYMSHDSIYLTYSKNTHFAQIYSDFITKRFSSHLPDSVVSDIQRVNSYDISPQSKMTEFQLILTSYYQTLNKDEALKIATLAENEMQKFQKEMIREHIQTSLVKISTDNLNIENVASVPGIPLNQFSLDEHEGYLRFATTAGTNFWGESANSENDIYILNKNLDITGKIQGLGITERIYAVRFIGNMGYIVTFRQIDPLYVIDISNPQSPFVAGELKIPGYSSYLQPLDNGILFGVGMEDGKVKVSLFDISNPYEPKEIEKLSLNEYWSEALNDHHAITTDEKNELIFIPGGNGGYVISYKDNTLSLAKAISGYSVKRAVYINNYFYVISDDSVRVFDENNWQEVNKLDF